MPTHDRLSSTEALPSGPSDPSRLAPEDAIYAHPPPRRVRQQTLLTAGTSIGTIGRGSRKAHKDRSRSRKKGQWKKLLWVEQQCRIPQQPPMSPSLIHLIDPDNYTDEDTFLHDLKRNPSFQQYDFWPLMADATVIVQHLCSVAIFICCFVGIIQERVSPVTIVSCGSFSTVFGWTLWDFWVGQEEVAEAAAIAAAETEEHYAAEASSVSSASPSIQPNTSKEANGLGIHLSDTVKPSGRQLQGHSHSTSAVSVASNISTTSALTTGHPTGASSFASYSHHPPYGTPVSSLSARNQQRLATAKSAILIYCALLGLSPILKSLTKSTTSDSIWAMSCWLMAINVFFFDYGGAVGSKFPASLSTNAALMASTVLASRLPSTTHVFSLTLFSIEVFGLFPVFRRHLRHTSWKGHLVLTLVLVAGAGGGVGVTVSGGAWKAAVAGIALGGMTTFLAMGICSWWLIGLQKYKNEIHGPWDPARPIIRRRWD